MDDIDWAMSVLKRFELHAVYRSTWDKQFLLNIQDQEFISGKQIPCVKKIEKRLGKADTWKPKNRREYDDGQCDNFESFDYGSGMHGD
jgi:hypothetical protein